MSRGGVSSPGIVEASMHSAEKHSSEGLWRDPRGNLHEPHTGKSVALGTREVAAYAFPDYVFDKILYVEKEGELSKLKAARLAERYDMAICSGKGQPTEAVRTLFERAEGGDYQLFVFHDADLDGYDIARVMAEETRRMPGYSVDVIDIDLTVEYALEMGLESEPFYRKKDITCELLMRLSGWPESVFTRRTAPEELGASASSSTPSCPTRAASTTSSASSRRTAHAARSFYRRTSRTMTV